MFGECRLLVVSFARQMNVFQIFSISISDLGFSILGHRLLTFTKCFLTAASKETLSGVVRVASQISDLLMRLRAAQK